MLCAISYDLAQLSPLLRFFAKNSIFTGKITVELSNAVFLLFLFLKELRFFKLQIGVECFTNELKGSFQANLERFFLFYPNTMRSHFLFCNMGHGSSDRVTYTYKMGLTPQKQFFVIFSENTTFLKKLLGLL